MEDVKSLVSQHPFFKDLKQEYLDYIVGCASKVSFEEGKTILKEGDPANKFYLIQRGRVAICISLSRTNSITIQTIHDGDILGWSWLIPPHSYKFHCQALENVDAIVLDGMCLRGKCEENHDLGYELLRRLAVIFTQRLEQTRKQLINIYDIERERK